MLGVCQVLPRATHHTPQKDYIMPSKPYPPDVLKQARRVLDALGQIDNQISIDPFNAGKLTENLKLAEDIHMQLINLANRMTDLRNQRDGVHQAIWDQVKRVRAAVRGIYGDDSSEYEMAGGTPISEKKSPRRKIPSPS